RLRADRTASTRTRDRRPRLDQRASAVPDRRAGLLGAARWTRRARDPRHADGAGHALGGRGGAGPSRGGGALVAARPRRALLERAPRGPGRADAARRRRRAPPIAARAAALKVGRTTPPRARLRARGLGTPARRGARSSCNLPWGLA